MDGSPTSLRAVVVLTVMMGLFSLLSVAGSEGQTTSITSAGLGTKVTLNGGAPVPTYDITGGTRPGNGTNLFHSFGEFSVGTHDIARFGNDSGLPTTNILSRVTGGQTSNIYGAIQTSGFGTAALWLINPAGIVFGPTASLNVGGSAHFSTADYLRLGSGNDRFYADLGKTSQLTSAAVTAFGFLNSNPASIAVKGSNLAVPNGETLSLIGGNRTFPDPDNPSVSVPSGVTMTGGSLSTPGGRIDIVSVASAGEVDLNNSNGPFAPPTFAGFTDFGRVALSQGASVDTSTTQKMLNPIEDVTNVPLAAGPIYIRAGKLEMSDSSVKATSRGYVFKGDNPDDLLGTNPPVLLDPYVDVQGGEITITAGTVSLSNSLIQTGSLPPELPPGYFSIGPAGHFFGDPELTPGRINLNVGTLSADNSVLNVGTTLLFGKAGPLNINGEHGQSTEANHVNLQGGAIKAEALAPLVDSPEDVTIHSREVVLNGLTYIGPTGERIAGQFRIMSSDSIDVSNSILRSTGLGASGDIILSAGKELNLFSTTLQPSAQYWSTGAVMLNAPAINVQAGSLVTQGTSVPAGDISLTAQSINLTNGAQLTADTNGTAKAGSITLNAEGMISITNGSTISSSSTAIFPQGSTPGPGDAGHIMLISGESISVANSKISTSATQASGGDIELTAPNMVRLVGANLTSSVAGPPGSNGGNITIDTAHPQFVIMQGNSQILAKANAGQGGAITIIGGVVLQDAGSVLDATAGPAGVSGTVNIQSPFQQLSGAIAPLPQAFAVATNLYGQRCATEKGGQFSSFVQGVRDGVPPQPGDLIPSPLLLESEGISPSLASQSSPNLAAFRLGLPKFDHPAPVTFMSFAGCRS